MTERKPNITTQYTRLTHADRLPDRFLTSQVYTPADPESQREGIIFSQIEILNPWFPTSQIGQTIINTVIREYYRATDTSELNNFETALKKVNETLSQVTQSGETDWIGNLHGILMLINGADIHISQTGQTQAYLFRGGKINHITEGLMDENEAHPLRTFSNITSGTLQAGDKIIIANPIFYRTIDLDLIKEIISGNPPALAAKEFANILKRNRALSGEAMIIDITTKDDAASLPLEYKTDTVYLDQGGMGSILGSFRGGLPRVNMGSSTSSFNKFKDSVKSTLKSADEKFDRHITPHVQSAAQKTYGAIKKSSDNLWRKMSKTPEGEPIRQPAFIKNINEKFSPTFKAMGRKFSFGDDNSPRGRARRFGIWGAALLIVLIILIFASRIPSRNSSATSDKLQNTITDLGEKFNKVKLMSAYNDKQVALNELAKIFSKINEIENQQELPPSLQELKKQAIDELGGLTNTKNINNISEKADWGNREYISGFGDNAFAINKNQITKVPSGDNKEIDLSNISAIAKNTDKDLIYLFSDKGLNQFDTTNKELSQVKLAAGDWPTSDSFVSFNDNLYFLDTKLAKLVKFTPREGGFNEGEDYSEPEGDELKNAIDITINGRVLALFKDGATVQYNTGGRQAVSYTELPTGDFIKNPRAIFADVESPDVVILHEDKWVNGLWHLTKFNRSGKYLESYFLPDSLKGWKNIDYDARSKVLWTVTESRIYRAQVGE